MKNQDDRPNPSDPSPGSGQALRGRAEEVVRADTASAKEPLSPEQARQALHELRVHQIELEMQNEELRRAQDELTSSRARYFDLYDLAPVGYVTLSEHSLILEANLTASTLLGLPKSLLNKSPLTRYIFPEDQDIYYPECKRLFETGERQVFEIRMRRLDDTLFWARIEAAAAQDPDGAPVCRIVMSDVTERRQAEAALQQAHDELEHRVAMRTKELTQANEELRESEGKHRLLFESAGDAIFIHDAEARILAVNSLACERLGYTHAELMSMRINQVDSSAEGHHAPDRIARLMAEGHLSFETVHQRKDGSHIPIEVSAQKIIWDSQPAMMTICRDITERKRAEDEKERLQAQLNQAQKMEALGTLVAGVAHEINNPISCILFNAPLLRKIWSDLQPVLEGHAAVEPQRKYGGLPYEFLKKDLVRLLEDVELAGNRIAAIVKGLKDFAKKSGVPEKKPMALNEAVENALRLTQSTLGKSGIEVWTKCRRGLPEMQGNLQNIEQVILNLIINAAQAIEHDKGVIELETGFDRRSGHLFVVVRDNGKGIEPGVRGRIFDPFFTNKQSAGGTGLGLAVSYSLIKAHDGSITFKSEVGKGTTFRVSLPCQRRERAARILVVDDEETVRDVVTGVLSRERVHLVEEARNGTEAMIQMGANHPDLLILDILMPDMDGVEVCRALRNMPELSDIKVIIITGFPDHPKVKKVAEMGFTDICIKPLDLKGFVKKVNRILGVGEVK